MSEQKPTPLWTSLGFAAGNPVDGLAAAQANPDEFFDNADTIVIGKIKIPKKMIWAAATLRLPTLRTEIRGLSMRARGWALWGIEEYTKVEKEIGAEGWIIFAQKSLYAPDVPFFQAVRASHLLLAIAEQIRSIK